jgi:anthranilate 3-monooxygenase (FAD) / 4-hydroxyphenylacetate 3-monooxygenase
MPARTGVQYVESLKRLKPCIYLNGRRIADVTQEPVFAGPLQAIAQLYDLQHDPRYRDFMLYPSPTTGAPVHVSFRVPRSREELIGRRKALKVRTDHNFGFMGRTMDFMNGIVTGWFLGRDRFARRGAHFGDNAVRYYEYVREHDLFLTHVLINPQIDRSRTSAEQEEPFLHLGKVGETPEGLIVRGAKMLGVVFQICTFIGKYAMVIPPLRGDAYGTRSRDVPLLSQRSGYQRWPNRDWQTTLSLPTDHLCSSFLRTGARV